MVHHGRNSLLQVSSHLLLPFLVLGVHIGHLGTKLLDSKALRVIRLLLKLFWILRIVTTKAGCFFKKCNASNTDKLDLLNLHQ